jgi:hypothetical protein
MKEKTPLLPQTPHSPEDISEFLMRVEALMKSPEVKVVSANQLGIIELNSAFLSDLLGVSPDANTQEFCTNLTDVFVGLDTRNKKVQAVVQPVGKNHTHAGLVHQTLLDFVNTEPLARVNPSNDPEVRLAQKKIKSIRAFLKKFRVLLTLQKDWLDGETRSRLINQYTSPDDEEFSPLWTEILGRPASKEFVGILLEQDDIESLVSPDIRAKLTAIQKKNTESEQNPHIETVRTAAPIEHFLPLIQPYFEKVKQYLPEWFFDEHDSKETIEPEKIVEMVSSILSNITKDSPEAANWSIERYEDVTKSGFRVEAENKKIVTPGVSRNWGEIRGLLMHEVLVHGLRKIRQTEIYDTNLIVAGEFEEGLATALEQWINKKFVDTSTVTYGKYNHRILLMALVQAGITPSEVIKLFKISYDRDLQTEDKGFTDLLQRVLRGAAYSPETGFINKKDTIYMEGTKLAEQWGLVLQSDKINQNKVLLETLHHINDKMTDIKLNPFDIDRVRVAAKHGLLQLSHKQLAEYQKFALRPQAWM